MLTDAEQQDEDDLAILCPADFEETIDELNIRIKQKDEENLHLTVELRHVKNEKDATDKKYQTLYDKYLAQQEKKQEPSAMMERDVKRLTQNVDTKESHVRELKKELLIAKSNISEGDHQIVELTKIKTELDLKLQEQSSEILKSDRLRELNSELHEQRDFYKEMMSKAESKLEEESQLQHNTSSQLERCKEKLCKLDDLTTDNIILSSKIEDLTNKLQSAKEDVAPLKSELKASQRSVREHASTISMLNNEIDMMRESSGGGAEIGGTLADDVQNFLPNRVESEKLQSDICNLKEQLEISTREESSLRHQFTAVTSELTNNYQLHEKEVSNLQQQITQLTVVTSGSTEKSTRLETELQLKDSERATLSKEVELLKEEITNISSQSTSSSNSLVAKLEQANKRSTEVSVVNTDLNEKLDEVTESKETLEKQLSNIDDKNQLLQDEINSLNEQIRTAGQAEQLHRETAKSLRFRLEVESERSSRLVKGTEEFRDRLKRAHRESIRQTIKLLRNHTSGSRRPSATPSPSMSYYTTPLLRRQVL